MLADPLQSSLYICWRMQACSTLANGAAHSGDNMEALVVTAMMQIWTCYLMEIV
jgi:hypothetical protein